MSAAYRKLGSSYVGLLAGLFLAWIFVLTVFHTAQAAPYLGADLDLVLKTLPAALLSEAVGALIWMPLLLRELRPIRTFCDRREDPRAAVAASEAIVVGLPRVLLLSMAWIVIFAGPPAAYMFVELGRGLETSLVAAVALALLIVAGTLIGLLGWEAALRPVARDASRGAPGRFSPAPEWTTLRFKLLAVPSASALYAATIASGLTSNASSVFGTVAVGLGAALGVTLTVSLAMTLLLRRSFLAPTEALVAATERVAAGRFEEPAPVLGGDELGRLTHAFNQMMDGLRERAAMHTALEAYVHPEVVERLVTEGPMLEGAEIEATVLFVDVRDFTSYAEKVTPAEAVDLLNRFFTICVPIIEREGGHANKFIGDGLLAAFGAPTPRPDHAESALTAACRISDAVDHEFKGEIRIGIGLNSGPVLVGTVGGGTHLEFGLIGDTVNVAARVEALTKEHGEVVLLTDATRRLLAAPAPSLRRTGQVQLRGKDSAVEVFAVPGKGNGSDAG